ncbi:methyltransferase [Brevundimonas intermedia]|uniref:Methyltransferase n=2 Tax=Brevundimonas intermedia TaxID=74315 RepID=A0A4Y9S3Z2_9CAUL|nr:methyltransferase [Brevundimonas intermedia]
MLHPPPVVSSLTSYDDAVLGLLAELEASDYQFTTPNRSTHKLVSQRRRADQASLMTDVFGWVRPFATGLLPVRLERLLQEAGLLAASEGLLRSRLRVGRVGDILFAHSAPGAAGDAAVFLGPDSHRFARFLRQTLEGAPVARRALDIGVGAGAGGLTLLSCGFAEHVVGSDVNPDALRLARLNAAHAGLSLHTRLGSGPPGAPEIFDLIVANPPFIAGASGVTYRDGGDLHGAALALDWMRAGVDRLTPGGRFILYTGAPVVEGEDVVRTALEELVRRRGLTLSYEEIDPDIFSSSLRSPAYRDVERIAAVGAVIKG